MRTQEVSKTSITGHDPEQRHELLKQMFSLKWFLSVPHLGVSGFGIPTSTTRMEALVFTDYIEKCRLWANEFLGLQIPFRGEIDS